MKENLQQKIASCFSKNFTQSPIGVQSAGRINLIGEHTDYNQGYVLPGAIDKSIIALLSKTDANQSTIIAYDMAQETYRFTTKNHAAITGGGWKNYILGIVAQLEQIGKPVGNFNMVFGGDIPSGAGLSSSAALENAVVYGLNILFDLGLSKQQMILISQQAEHKHVGVQCGIMDQFASMFGKENTFLLLDCKTLQSKEVSIDFKNYELVLINTHVTHNLADSAYNQRRAECEAGVKALQEKFKGITSLRDATIDQLQAIKPDITDNIYQRCLYVIEENQRVLQTIAAIEKADLQSVGELLFASHNGLQNQYQVSCDALDFLVEQAKKHDAIIGSRMMGGGFGGCTINLIEKGAISDFKNTIASMYQEKFDRNLSIYPICISNGTQQISL